MALRGSGTAARIKAVLQSRGVRFPLEDSGLQRPLGRRGGAGPAEGITLLLQGSPASVPAGSSFASSSPYRVANEEGRWLLYERGEPILEVQVPHEPHFYRRTTSQGIPYKRIALLHGKDCLASTILQTCQYWSTPAGCRFCGIGISLREGATVALKRAEDLAAVAMEAKKEGAAHVTLTSGSTRDREEEVRLYREASAAIRSASGLPVHVQLLPPLSRSRMEELKDAGVCSIGIHCESFDRRVLERSAACKAAIPQALFREAWRAAVGVFGRGQVSSFVLLGLGEDRRVTEDGIRELAELGVYPFLVPLRPIPGTPLQGLRPPEPEECIELYEYASGILKECGLWWRSVAAGCVRCRGCSALPDFEDLAHAAGDIPGDGASGARGITCRVAESGEEIQECLRIWHEVFVEEQGLRLGGGAAGEDGERGSVYILASLDAVPVGTVRISPTRDDGTWRGSRLAVRQGFRGGCGRLLVEKAQAEVRARGGRRLVAYVQMPRVGFFERCGWRRLQEIPDYCGVPHMLMEVEVAEA